MVGEPMLRTMSDEPVRAERGRHRLESHIAPLTALVERMRHETDHESIPWFDPKSGGIEARILLLLEAPGPKAAPAPSGSKIVSSEFVSLDNDDRTAATLHELPSEAGIDRESVLMWNIVPWYLGNSAHTHVKPAGLQDLEEGAHWLKLLLTELVSLQVVLLFGEKPLTGWFKIATQLGKLLPVLASPHPSPRSLNSHPERRGEILRTLQATRALTATS